MHIRARRDGYHLLYHSNYIERYPHYKIGRYNITKQYNHYVSLHFRRGRRPRRASVHYDAATHANASQIHRENRNRIAREKDRRTMSAVEPPPPGPQVRSHFTPAPSLNCSSPRPPCSRRRPSPWSGEPEPSAVERSVYDEGHAHAIPGPRHGNAG